MASPTYTRVLTTITGYVGKEKAEGLMERQLAHCSATPDSFSIDHYKQVLVRIQGAAALYVSDPGKKEELKKALAGVT